MEDWLLAVIIPSCVVGTAAIVLLLVWCARSSDAAPGAAELGAKKASAATGSTPPPSMAEVLDSAKQGVGRGIADAASKTVAVAGGTVSRAGEMARAAKDVAKNTATAVLSPFAEEGAPPAAAPPPRPSPMNGSNRV